MFQNSDQYILKLGQKNLAICTNIFDNLDKYVDLTEGSLGKNNFLLISGHPSLNGRVHKLNGAVGKNPFQWIVPNKPDCTKLLDCTNLKVLGNQAFWKQSIHPLYFHFVTIFLFPSKFQFGCHDCQ